VTDTAAQSQICDGKRQSQVCDYTGVTDTAAQSREICDRIRVMETAAQSQVICDDRDGDRKRLRRAKSATLWREGNGCAEPNLRGKRPDDGRAEPTDRRRVEDEQMRREEKDDDSTTADSATLLQ
jgi:hypothetical protein